MAKLEVLAVVSPKAVAPELPGLMVHTGLLGSQETRALEQTDPARVAARHSGKSTRKTAKVADSRHRCPTWTGAVGLLLAGSTPAAAAT